MIQNSVVTDVRFLFWELSMSRSLMILTVLGAGIVIGWLLYGFTHHHRLNKHERE